MTISQLCNPAPSPDLAVGLFAFRGPRDSVVPMYKTVNPAALARLDVIRTATVIGNRAVPDDYVLMCGERTVGRVWKAAKADMQMVCQWSLTGPAPPAEDGFETTLEDAEYMLRLAFKRWLARHAGKTSAGWQD